MNELVLTYNECGDISDQSSKYYNKFRVSTIDIAEFYGLWNIYFDKLNESDALLK